MPGYTVLLDSKDPVVAKARTAALKWEQVKQAIALGSKLGKEKLLTLKPTALAAEVASLKSKKKGQ